ncbi:MAG: leucine-rich repeat protein, partial [Clostridiales bacterium]|nr:leucine-rich repeat protein [Clostridiales bacterium]
IFVVSALFILKPSSCSYTAYAQEYTVDDIRELLKEESNSAYLEVYNEDGTMQMIPEPVITQNNSQSITNPLATQTFNERKIFDSGKPDSDSIIVTIMGDGFTATQQNDFINAATDAMEKMLGNPKKNIDGCYPFNLFRNYFTVYAIEVISNESGVSRDADINNGAIVDNYFGSSFYGGSDTGTIDRLLVIANYDRASALEKPNSAMTAIICNSIRWGGTGGQFAVLSIADNYERALVHEFGHSFGGLADEYYYPSDGPFFGKEAPNSTRNSDENSIKWENLLGINGVGIYPYSIGQENKPGFDPNSKLWFKPHLNCKMQATEYDFCPVCADELIKKLEFISKAVSFKTNDVGDTIIGAVTELSAISIPEEIEGVTIKAIGDSAFSGYSGLMSITIPSSVISIGDSAFAGTGLTEVAIPNSVTSIGNYVFNGCPLKSIRLPLADSSSLSYTWSNFKKVITATTIPASLKKVVISNGTVIPYAAFQNCSYIEEIVIPKTIKTIENFAFDDCISLRDFIIPDGVISIGMSFTNCTSLTSIVIPSSVERLGSEAFAGATLRTVELQRPAYMGITSISYSALGINMDGYEPMLDYILVPDYDSEVAYKEARPELANLFCYKFTYTLQSDGTYAISKGAFNLSGELTIPSTYKGKAVTKIAGSAFAYFKQITNVTLPSSIKSIGDYAFRACSGLTSIAIPSSVTSIGRFTFGSCSGLTSITIPSSVTSIGAYAFRDCSGLTSIVIPSSVSSISTGAFYGCSGLISITILSSVKSIGTNAFRDCTGLTSVTIPSSVTSIGDYAFSNTGLTSITIPSSVTSIASTAFANCSKLVGITVNSANKVYKSDGNCIIRIEDNALIVGCNSSVIPSYVTSIESRAFSGMSGLKSVTVPASLTTIEKYAFEGCTNLTSAVFEAPNCWIAIYGEIMDECYFLSLSDPKSAAKQLIEYTNCYWMRTPVVSIEL